jgi:hypothetical protein
MPAPMGQMSRSTGSRIEPALEELIRRTAQETWSMTRMAFGAGLLAGGQSAPRIPVRFPIPVTAQYARACE